MKFQLMQPGQETLVIKIVSSTFDEFVAPGYSDDGISEFYKFANEKDLAKRSQINYFTILAQKNNVPMGIIEVRDNSHIAMFFVMKQFQKSGVGKALLQESINHLLKTQKLLKALTVNASPNSVEAYKKMGFKSQDKEQNVNGIRFVPMSLLLNLNTDSEYKSLLRTAAGKPAAPKPKRYLYEKTST
ncbi:MAG: GNAT family N-acetyltransferase [Desulfobacteraceae bacterium]|nr:MAG: GNAT family N-acetyltransferase [Desulfobacteraceae bacterium]